MQMVGKFSAAAAQAVGDVMVLGTESLFSFSLFVEHGILGAYAESFLIVV